MFSGSAPPWAGYDPSVSSLPGLPETMVHFHLCIIHISGSATAPDWVMLAAQPHPCLAGDTVPSASSGWLPPLGFLTIAPEPGAAQLQNLVSRGIGQSGHLGPQSCLSSVVRASGDHQLFSLTQHSWSLARCQEGESPGLVKK